MRRLSRHLTALLVVIAGCLAAPASGATGPVVLHEQGRFLADAQGRVVMLHGVNAVWKRAPYVPPTTAAGSVAEVFTTTGALNASGVAMSGLGAGTASFGI